MILTNQNIEVPCCGKKGTSSEQGGEKEKTGVNNTTTKAAEELNAKNLEKLNQLREENDCLQQKLEVMERVMIDLKS